MLCYRSKISMVFTALINLTCRLSEICGSSWESKRINIMWTGQCSSDDVIGKEQISVSIILMENYSKCKSDFFRKRELLWVARFIQVG